jgi:hypothetical protein
MAEIQLCKKHQELLRSYHPCEIELCKNCQISIDRFCFCCETFSDEPIGEEGVCKNCLRKQTWYKEDLFEEIRE